MKPSPHALALLLLLSPALAQDGAGDPGPSPEPTSTGDTVNGADPGGEAAPGQDPTPDPAAAAEEPRPTVVVEAQGPEWDAMRLDAVGPLGVSTHEEYLSPGTFGVRLRTRHAFYDGTRDGRDKLSSADLFARGYTAAPTDAERDEFELEVLYGLDSDLTLWLTVPYVRTSVDQDLSGGGSASTSGSGLGDLLLGANYLVHEASGERVGVSLGFALPTGKYDDTGDWAGVDGSLLPYFLQPADGTFDLVASASWWMQMRGWTWGARAQGRWPLSQNSDDWNFSRGGKMDLWAATPFTRSLSGSVRLNVESWGDVHGAALALNPARSPLEDAARQGGLRAGVYGGVAWDLSPQRGAGSNRLELEVGVPVDEWLDGPGMRQTLVALFGWRLAL